MMDISSDSSDTVILSPPRNNVNENLPSDSEDARLSLNNDISEPSDSEVENILKKYSSYSGNIESKECSSSQSNICEQVAFRCEENAVDIPSKRLKICNKYGTESGENKSERMEHILEDCLSEDNMQKNFEYKFISAENINNDCDDLLKELYGKYRSSSKIQPETTSKNPYAKANNLLGSMNSGETVDLCVISDDDLDEKLQAHSSKESAKVRKQKELENKRKERAREKVKRQIEAEQRKVLKNMEKERKKEEMARQKAMKMALKTVEQSTKADECMKNMLVEIDPGISQKVYGESLKVSLKNNDISLKSTSQVLPNLISWCRKVQTIEDMLVADSEVKQKQFLLIMDDNEFIKHIKSSSLVEHVRNVYTLTECKHLTLAVFGIDTVKGDQDLAIAEVQMLTKCYFRFVKDSVDLASLVMELTKAIAQIPYKLKKDEAYKLHSEYFSDSNKDTVRVDKNGNGLGRLWHQMLTMFPLARLETAEAITAKYPTPNSLFEAYDRSQSKKEELLQDLPIRRALGPCASVRRIGPELSRKCFNFFCSEENVLL